MTDIQRKLASIREVTEIRPIPDADAIECAIVGGGWPVVVKRGEFNPGDLALYFEIDSWIPHDLAPFLSKGKEPREYNGVKGERLRTLKLRGQVSQGLLLGLSKEDSALGPLYTIKTEKVTITVDHEDISNLTEILGIQKWEAPVPACLAGQVRGNFPSFIPKTDQERCQNLTTEIFEEHKGETYEVTLKLDGSSCTVYAKDGDFGVCSRNLDLKETEGNSFWQAARKQLLIDALAKLQTVGMGNFALQMELIGEGIQGNQEKIKGQRLYLFDVYNIDKQAYLNPVERQRLLDSLVDAGADLGHTPVLEPSLVVTDRFNTVEELLAFADGPSLNPSVKREGLVFKSHNSQFSFKAISNKWLLKNQG